MSNLLFFLNTTQSLLQTRDIYNQTVPYSLEFADELLLVRLKGGAGGAGLKRTGAGE